MECTPLPAVESEAEFGGKAVRLGIALRAGFPVPPGFALSVALVERLVGGSAAESAGGGAAESAGGGASESAGGGASESASEARAVRATLAMLGGRVAVRSSAVGEDASDASFAGQHLTVLGVTDEDGLMAAIASVWQSGHSEAALAYRRKLQIAGPPRIAVVIQQLVDAECAGVLFTVNPLTGADERVIEAAWGLGEAVVAGLVTPDHYRVRRDGEIVERTMGDKDLAIRPAPGGGTVEVAVPEPRAQAACLDDAQLRQLNELAARCEAGSPVPVDLEWAFAGGQLYLLQRRDVTRSR